MNNIQKIDPSTWYRKDQFEFYRTFKQPFFNVCATVDVSSTARYCKDHNVSFFLCSLFILGHTANQIEAFRLRINKDKVDVHTEIALSCTVLNKDESFSFCEFGACHDFDSFYANGTEKLNRIKQGHKSLVASNSTPNNIFCSVLPWLHFTSFAHAQKQNDHDSIPRIVMGKYKKINNELAMPVSVEVHHALVDGVHIGQYFERLQQNFDNFFQAKKKPDNESGYK